MDLISVLFYIAVGMASGEIVRLMGLVRQRKADGTWPGLRRWLGF
jgi:hypothetical protein